LPAREAVLTMTPGWPNISGRIARLTRKTEKRLTSTVRIHAASSYDKMSAGTPNEAPALLTRMCTWPHLDRSLSAMAATDAESVTSVSAANAFTPNRFPRSAAIVSISSRVPVGTGLVSFGGRPRSAITTLQPQDPRRSAMA